MEELEANQDKRDVIQENFDSFCSLLDISLLEQGSSQLRERVDDINQEWRRIEDRVRCKISQLKVRNKNLTGFFLGG